MLKKKNNTQKGNADACTKRSQCCHPPGGREACLAIAWPKNTCGKFHIALHVFIRFVIVVVVVGESHTTLEHSASLFFCIFAITKQTTIKRNDNVESEAFAGCLLSVCVLALVSGMCVCVCV